MPIALITGCAGGIGRDICVKFASAGYTVFGIDRFKCSIDGVVTHCVDLNDVAAVEKFCQLFDRLDALVNVAALQVCKPFWELSLTEWDTTYGVNVRAVWLLCKHLKTALTAGQGSVVNIASVHSLATSANIAAYGSSKAAVVGLTRNLAIELAPFGIRVNAVSPGAIDTPMLRDGLQRAVSEQVTFNQAWDAFNAKQPLGQVGRTEDISRMCLYLCQPETNSFVTGSNFVIDGGVMARLATE